MSEPDLPELDRWLYVGTTLIKVTPGSTGPDVFCKLLDAEAAIATERARADALQAENALLKNAVEECFDTVQSMDWVDSDSDSAIRRTTLRRLNEAVGKALPRLLMERPEGQKLYALRWNELTERADSLEAALLAALKHAKANGMQGWPVFVAMERALLEKKT